MTTTDDLIARLAADTPSVSRHAGAMRLAGGLAFGAAVSFALLVILFGRPFGAVFATGLATFGVKLCFTIGMVSASAALLYRVGQPGRSPGLAMLWLLVPPMVIAVIGAIALGATPAESRPLLLWGDTWATCLASVTLLSVPVFAALCWSFRRLAPTDLPTAGMIAGIGAASVAAFLYALHCPETSPVFLLVWYGLAIVIAGVVGRLVGPRILRW